MMKIDKIRKHTSPPKWFKWVWRGAAISSIFWFFGMVLYIWKQQYGLAILFTCAFVTNLMSCWAAEQGVLNKELVQELDRLQSLIGRQQHEDKHETTMR